MKRRNTDNEITKSDAPGALEPTTDHFITQPLAEQQIQLWPAFSQPTETWVRKTLVRTGAAANTDSVSMNYMVITTVPEHERAALALLRRIAKIAEADVDVLKFVAICGRGTIEKRIARVNFVNGGARICRLDIENRNARQMFENER
jgi:hypothetical protein